MLGTTDPNASGKEHALLVTTSQPLAGGCLSLSPMSPALVQIFLPLRDNDGTPFARDMYVRIYDELASRHGGATAFNRSPASGLWATSDDEVVEDVVVLIEVLVDELDRAWWKQFRLRMERDFRQERILARALACELL